MTQTLKIRSIKFNDLWITSSVHHPMCHLSVVEVHFQMTSDVTIYGPAVSSTTVPHVQLIGHGRHSTLMDALKSSPASSRIQGCPHTLLRSLNPSTCQLGLINLNVSSRTFIFFSPVHAGAFSWVAHTHYNAIS